MQRLIVAALAPVVLCALAFLSGCGSESGNEIVESSPAAKKATLEGQEAMRAAMQAKSASKGKASGKPASKP